MLEGSQIADVSALLPLVPGISDDQRQVVVEQELGLAAVARDAVDMVELVDGDLEALKHRSRLTEVDALTDESGLGAFRVLEWEVRR